MSKLPKHILVIRLSAMGDVAMTIPVLRAFTEQYPEVKLTVLTREFFTPFFRDLKNVSVYAPDLKGKHEGFFGLLELSKELRILGIDAVADLHNVLRSKILKIFLLDLKIIQVDKGRTEKKALVNGKVFEQLKTTHQRYRDVFEKLGFPIKDSDPIFPERAELNSKTLELVGKGTKNWIGIAPFAAYKSKMYPLELMEEVINELSKNYKILLFGGEAEAEYLSSLENDQIISIAGKLSLDEELDLISNLDVMLSMDSGNAHMAAMLGVKVVTLWGVTHPYAGFFPFHQNENNALLADREKFPRIPTSIYGNKFPEGYETCMATISPKDIIEKIENIIKKPR
ncbi:glycosyltransferase family 9 protein [Gelidibacter gilvus]|uniref:Lipopolysaccharide heptosyltransferase family protein n=1 Tax=Gelidibacter gilvus TaxID=59602 RepID=A0A4Q0XKC6_9FLAO|nr:glycosyltransferase family 9 protein [Gelidibacter gilvus]RXJ52464.1 lipopolysaccharide heptosyltransferase family protein [Gelidibacter gilvus]